VEGGRQGGGNEGGRQGGGNEGGRQGGGNKGGQAEKAQQSTDDFFAKRNQKKSAPKAVAQKDKDKDKPQALPADFDLSIPAPDPEPVPKVEAKPDAKPVVKEPKSEKPKAAEKLVEKQDPKVEAEQAQETTAEDWENEVDEVEKVKEEPKPTEEPKIVEEKAKPTPVAKPAEEEEVEEVVAQNDKRGSSQLAVPDSRPHMNVVFIGHVDAGKSTTCGNILYLCNCVDERQVEKYQKEAKEKNRESWFLAYIMDTNEEEKEKGKTVEVGRAGFELEDRRFTILDAPGHKAYVPNMIQGASQADIGVLIISARKGEFETGFERGGQTREHAQLARTLGVEKLVIAVNKMDDPSVEWEESRFDEIKSKLMTFIKPPQFKDVSFLPISGLTGDNIKEKRNTPTWWKGDTLFDILNTAKVPERDEKKSFRIPMLDGYKDMGSVMAVGKVEQGVVKPGMKCLVQPIGQKCTIVSVCINDEEMQYAGCGENISMKMNGISEDELKKGYVLCPIVDTCRAVTKFKAQLQILELPEERPVMTAGYKCILHCHVALEDCEVFKLYESIDPKKKPPNNKLKSPPFVREGMIVLCSIALPKGRPCAVDIFKNTQALGRFTLRDEGRTIAIGTITELAKDK